MRLSCSDAQNGLGPSSVHALQMCCNCPLTCSFREGLLRPGKDFADISSLLETKSSCNRKENANNYKIPLEKKS